MTKVLVNALALHNKPDGTRTVLESLIKELPDAWPDADFTVLIRQDGWPLSRNARMALVPIGSARSGATRVFSEVVRLPLQINRVDPDVVISPNESIPVGVNAPLVVIAQNLVYHCASVSPLSTGPLRARLRSQLQFMFYRLQMPRAYARATVVVAVSWHAAEELAKHAGLDLARVRVIPNGADRLPVTSVPRGSGAGRRVLLMVGALAPYKRIETAIAALSILRRGGGDYELVLAGAAWPGYGEALDDFASTAGVGPFVRRLGGVPDRLLADLFADAHAVVALSRCESFGIPVLEAMRAGLPVVVADEPWSAETVGDAAVRVQGSDPLSVAAGIGALERAEDWQRRADAGRRLSARYTWKRTASAIAAVAREVARVRETRDLQGATSKSSKLTTRSRP